MTIKKLTVAAAIAVGIATCSFSNAMAACPCNSSQAMTGCPCQEIVTPATAKCPICGLDKTSCGCEQKSSCGCNTPAPCCEKPAEPACATCPSTSCSDLDMKQVYGYPSAIFGTNNYTGDQSNAIYSTESAWCVDGCDALGLSRAVGSMAGLGQLTGAASGCGCSTGCGSGASPICNSCQGGAVVNRNTTGCHNNGYTGMYTASHSGCNNNSCCASMPVITGAACGCGNEAIPLTGCAAPITSGCGCASNCCSTTIQTSNSLDAIKKSFLPFTPNLSLTGAAAPLVNVFPDVPAGYWAGCDIDRLAATNVVAGYPDRTFKPSLPVSRAEFASMMVKGMNLNIAGCDCLPSKKLFKDVPLSNWANPYIAKAVEEGIMCGYSNGKFMPKRPVSRAEALTALAHGVNCDLDACKAQSILSKYCDGAKVPDWAQIPVAKALETGVLKDSPAPNTINPCKDASRADIASMLQNLRIAAGYDKDPTPTATNTDCGCNPKKAYMESQEMVKIPTLKLCFRDEINAKSSNVGDIFAANTSEEVTINGKCYPKGSRVNGKIVEVIRPSGCEKGALKLAFTDIQDCSGCKTDLPKQILTAQIDCARTQNIFARLIATPFTFAGGLIGTTGRTLGGIIASAGNAVEAVGGGVGIAASDVLQGPCVWPAAGRSLLNAGKATVMAPIDATRTAIAGTVGLFQTGADEVAYLVDPNGSKISAVNPKEKVTIAFGCAGH